MQKAKRNGCRTTPFRISSNDLTKNSSPTNSKHPTHYANIRHLELTLFLCLLRITRRMYTGEDEGQAKVSRRRRRSQSALRLSLVE